jgi:hypothetical protein
MRINRTINRTCAINEIDKRSNHFYFCLSTERLTQYGVIEPKRTTNKYIPTAKEAKKLPENAATKPGLQQEPKEINSAGHRSSSKVRQRMKLVK